MTKVLVVDDNNVNSHLIERTLRRFDKTIEFFFAYTGLEALKQVEANQPDIIFMDVHMPDMTGIEATQILKNDPDTAHIPIVIVTADAMSENTTGARNAGCDDLLIKPFSMNALRSLYQKYMTQEAE